MYAHPTSSVMCIAHYQGIHDHSRVRRIMDILLILACVFWCAQGIILGMRQNGTEI